MSDRIKELREQRAKAWEDMKVVLDAAEGENRNLTSEEREKYEKLEADELQLKERIERLEAHDASTRSAGRKTETQLIDPKVGVDGGGLVHSEQVSRAFAGWLKYNSPVGSSDEELDAARALGVNVRSPEISMRALDGGDTSAGGYSVPDEMMRAFWDAQLFFANIRPHATVWKTATGADLPIPLTDDTSNSGAIIGQNTAVVTTADPVFSQVVLGAFKYSSKAILVPVELLQDSFINLPQFLGMKLGERIGRAQSAHFATGTGTGEPQGVVDIAGSGKEAAATNAITLDEVIDLFHAVDIAYRPSGQFMMNDLVAAALRKLKDSDGQYLWQMSTQVGQPDTLFGKPVVINNGMQSTLTTNKKVVLFGDFSTYYIRDAGEVVLARANERYIDNHQVGFLAFQRTDAKGVSSSAIKYLTTKTS